MLQFCWNWITFAIGGSDVQLHEIRTLSFWSYKACNSLCFASGRWFCINMWQKRFIDCFFWCRCALHWRREHRNLCKVCFLVWLSTREFLQKSDTLIQKGSTFPDHVNNPSAFPAAINITVLLMSSIALISVWTRTFYGTWLQQLLCHSTTLMIHTLCPISTLNQQLTNLKLTHIRCSLHCGRSTVKRRDCASASHSF